MLFLLCGIHCVIEMKQVGKQHVQDTPHYALNLQNYTNVHWHTRSSFFAVAVARSPLRTPLFALVPKLESLLNRRRRRSIQIPLKK
jgi:hypothetical protein